MSARVTTTVAELRELLASDEPPVVLDVRWALGDPHGRAHYAEAHIPGAVYVDLDTELAAPPSPEGGRHPLPRTEDLQEAVRRWGIRQGQQVVVHDDLGNTAAARAWWLLRHAGLTGVTLLDGALGAWRAAGLPLESGVPADPPPGDVVLAEGALPTVDAEGAAELARSGLLLDARAAERYRGEVEPVDPVAGHIPGAVSSPTSLNVGPDGRLMPAESLRERFASLGVDGSAPVGAYCGSGVTASQLVLALEVAGVEAALYAGSWSDWIRHGLPVATGPA